MCPIRQWSPVLLHHRHKREAKQLLLSFLLCCMNEEEQLCKMSKKTKVLRSLKQENNSIFKMKVQSYWSSA